MLGCAGSPRRTGVNVDAFCALRGPYGMMRPPKAGSPRLDMSRTDTISSRHRHRTTVVVSVFPVYPRSGTSTLRYGCMHRRPYTIALIRGRWSCCVLESRCQ
ncbi:hypothetical protein PLEOSDRAFT_1090877 [Pleurotus ostreatus PC15]|uniref:Uncharacterized protein n=1 Tax=Pleurotus ostreatus (strain PC15) TaxID=1137138 RepID=A0A067N657_PLEO1|nr:hypothetical protein PLEOSDRAFT_1090877 [Pleurotus ostreatus PC15]